MTKSPNHPPAVVLLVEDEPLVRMLGADVLSDAGYIVIEAANAAEALRALETCKTVSLLFTDVNMPGSVDGLKLAQIVHQRWPDIRLLIVSGREGPTAAQIPDDGRFMQKPYDMDNMLKQIRELLAETPYYEPQRRAS